MAISFRSANIGAFCTKLHLQLSTHLRRNRLFVCVTPWTKGSPSLPLPPVFQAEAGGQGLQRRTLSNEAKSLEGKRMETSIRVPATEKFAQAVPLSVCFTVVSRYFPQTYSSPAAAPPFRPLLSRACRWHKPLVQTSTIDRTPHLTVVPFLSLGN